MKIGGRKISGVNIEYAVLPRPEGHVVFKAAAVLDYSECEALNVKPTPPQVRPRGGALVPDFEDPEYLKAVSVYVDRKHDWMVLTSLKATEGLEWDSVSMSEPATWGNYEKDLTAAGFSPIEIRRIIRAVMIANSLDDAKLEAARQSFLATLLPQAAQ